MKKVKTVIHMSNINPYSKALSKMKNIPNIPIEIMTNRINISFRDCLQLEIESNELKFEDVKKEILDLLKIIKKDLLEAEKKPNEHEVA